MLKNLTITNAKLSVDFNPLNTRYTIILDSEIEKLDIKYEIDDKDNISIFNNLLDGAKKEVVITVYNDEEQMSYYLEVYPPKEKSVLTEDDYFTQLEVNNKEYMSPYIAPLIGVSCFLLILTFFCFLFKKSKKC